MCFHSLVCIVTSLRPNIWWTKERSTRNYQLKSLSTAPLLFKMHCTLTNTCNLELSVEISLYSCSSLQMHCTLTNTRKYMYQLKFLCIAALLFKCTALQNALELSVEISLYSYSSLKMHCTSKYIGILSLNLFVHLLFSSKCTALSWAGLLQTKKKGRHSRVKANTNTNTWDNIDRYL